MTSNNGWKPVSGLYVAPPTVEDSVRLRRLIGASGRPLKLTVTMLAHHHESEPSKPPYDERGSFRSLLPPTRFYPDRK